MSSNSFWFGVVVASDDARRAKARRNARKAKAVGRARRSGVASADPTRSRGRETVDTVVGVVVLAVRVWLWLR